MGFSGASANSFTSAEAYLDALTEDQLYALERSLEHYRLEEDKALHLFRQVFEGYEELIKQIPQEDIRQHEFLFVLLNLAFNRVAIGDRIIYVLHTAVDSGELSNELSSFHRLSKEFREDTLRSLTGLPPILKEIKERESEAFLDLLNELRVLIQSEGKQCVSSKYREFLWHFPNDKPGQGLSDIHEKASSIGNPIALEGSEDDQELNENEVLIVFSDKARAELEEVLLPYVKKESQKALLKLIAGEAIEEYIYFKGSLSQLTEIFKDLKIKKLHVFKKAKDIGRWLEAYFIYYNQQDKKYVNVNETSATRYLRQKQGMHRLLK